MSVELVILDMAGTTVEDGDAVVRSFRQALQQVGVEVDRQDAKRVMGLAKPVAIRKLWEARSARLVSPDQVAVVHRSFVSMMVEHFRSSPDVREREGATMLFRQLGTAHVKVALDTGFSREIVDIILERLGWSGAGLLDATVTSDEVARGRPHPDMVERAMALTAIADSRLVAKVGDTPADLEEGVAAGCGLVIGITGGSHAREELSACPHTHLVDHLAELLPILTSTPR